MDDIMVMDRRGFLKLGVSVAGTTSAPFQLAAKVLPTAVHAATALEGGTVSYALRQVEDAFLSGLRVRDIISRTPGHSLDLYRELQGGLYAQMAVATLTEAYGADTFRDPSNRR